MDQRDLEAKQAHLMEQLKEQHQKLLEIVENLDPVVLEMEIQENYSQVHQQVETVADFGIQGRHSKVADLGIQGMHLRGADLGIQRMHLRGADLGIQGRH